MDQNGPSQMMYLAQDRRKNRWRVFLPSDLTDASPEEVSLAVEQLPTTSDDPADCGNYRLLHFLASEMNRSKQSERFWIKHAHKVDLSEGRSGTRLGLARDRLARTLSYINEGRGGLQTP